MMGTCVDHSYWCTTGFMHAWVLHMDLDIVWSPNIKWRRIPWACRWNGKHMGMECAKHETRSSSHYKSSIGAKLLESIPPRFQNLGWFLPSYPFSLSLFQFFYDVSFEFIINESFVSSNLNSKLENKAWINYRASLMCRLGLPLAQRGSLHLGRLFQNNVLILWYYLNP